LEGQNVEISSQRNRIAELAEEARRSTEAKLRFFTNFSHELRTPLTLILGPVEELLTAPADALAPAHRHDLKLVRRNTQRLMQLVNQLLDFRKIDVGKMAVRATEGNLIGFVREIMDVFEKIARQRGITFRFLPAEPVINLWFDGDILDKGSQPSANSSGLGLALAEGLTRLHEGKLSFKSQLGHGSTFEVTLPLARPATFLEGAPALVPSPAHQPIDEPAELVEEAAPAATDVTALIIEDQDELRQFLEQKLRPHFQVSTAADGATGQRLAAETLPDIIVCDVNLPELTGLEVVAQLKGDWRTSHIPLVLLTARNAPEQQVAGVQAGADLYLTKPFNPTFLLES
nr:putative LOV domain-containing protein [Tanacetum cinerariifolium]